MPRLFALTVVVVVIGLPLWWFERVDPPRYETDLLGEVRDEKGPVAGAVVRIKGRPDSVDSDRYGRFRLPRSSGASRVTASKDGYFIAGESTKSSLLIIRLKRLPAGDCERYEWVDPTPDPAKPMNCGNCHPAIHDEWQRSGHAHSATNRRFLNLYDGTDWHGKPGVGWNLLKDHEQGADVCASCHAPTQNPGAFGSLDMRQAAKGSHGLSGVHCDFCHKIQGPGSGEFGLSHGRFQLQLLRPDLAGQKQHQLFFGPLDDVDRGDDSFGRFQRDSKLCAACHEGVVFGVPVYTTYSEWQVSPAARSGTSCRSCHMTPTGKMSNIAPGHGGIRRDPATLGNHRFFDGSQLDMLRNSLKLETEPRRVDGGVAVDVSLTAQNVGHRVPTGFIDRQVILFVEAFADGQSIALIKGAKLPGVLGPEAGRPGRLYAKWMTDDKGPAPFWKADPATLIDTRLRPGETDRQTFVFPPGTDRVRIRLVHRRFWKQVAEEKHWPTDEQIIVDNELCWDGVAWKRK